MGADAEYHSQALGRARESCRGGREDKRNQRSQEPVKTQPSESTDMYS